MKTPLFVILLGGILQAQELLPELAPHAQTHKTAVGKLAERKAAEVARIRQPYLTALADADQAATAAGNMAAMGAISKERKAAEKGAVKGASPAGLPKSLAPARHTMIGGLEQLEADFTKRRKEIDAAYLRALGALQPKADGDAALAAQIASEKDRLLSGISGPVTDLRKGLIGTTWKLVEGKGTEAFQFRPEGTVNGLWKYEALARDKVKLQWDKGSAGVFTLGKDGQTLRNGGNVWKLVTETN